MMRSKIIISLTIDFHDFSYKILLDKLIYTTLIIVRGIKPPNKA